jgi:UDP-N-acetylglucosamine 4-epimerase
LYDHLRRLLLPQFAHLNDARPAYEDFRAGDVQHSQADISKATALLGYVPTHRVAQGLAEAMAWYTGKRRG